MKKLILLILLSVPTILFGQGHFTIKGAIGRFDAQAKIFLSYKNGAASVVDSTIITKGGFAFSGEVKDITLAELIIDYKGVGIHNMDYRSKYSILNIYLVHGTTLVSSPDSLQKAKITGTKLNEDNQRYQAFIKPAVDAEEALSRIYYSTPSEKRSTKEFSDYYNKQDGVIQAQSKALNKQFVEANPSSYISLVALKGFAGPYPDINMLEQEYNKLSGSVRKTTEGVAYQEYINSLKTVAVGAMAPDFAEPDTNGKVVSLSSFRGKYVLVDFWASWCGPCRAENPNLVKAFNNFKGRNFTVLGVSLDSKVTKDAWLKAIHTDHLTWNHISDLKFWNNAAVLLYGIRAVPQNLLIGPDGKIIAKNLFGEELESKLAELSAKN